MFNIWNDKFDRIFCLSLADNIERRELASEDFGRVGILDSGIFEWKITVRNPFYKYIWTNPNLPAEKWWLNIDGSLNCTLGHYEIMKQSLAIGYEHILILEDDARFHNDLSVIVENLDNLPEYDIALFDKFIPISKEPYFKALREDKINEWYFDYSKVKLWSCGCYGLSKKGMEHLTRFQELFWVPADHVTNKVDNEGRMVYADSLKRVASIKNLAIQDFYKKVYRDEATRNTDKIIYEGIANRNEYNVKEP